MGIEPTEHVCDGRMPHPEPIEPTSSAKILGLRCSSADV